ncbi:MAG: hypothetical protein DRJ44_02780 [Thermoprotei archaeon]|nr:MAG: hypothetical protein DRJ44_02780 [Thermoprotei archaeon]
MFNTPEQYNEAIELGYTDEEIAKHIAKERNYKLGTLDAESYSALAKEWTGVTSIGRMKVPDSVPHANVQVAQYNAKNMGDIERGVKQGMYNVIGSWRGVEALFGGMLKKLGAKDTGDAIMKHGLEGYQEAMAKAAEFPTTSWKEAEGVGGVVDYVQGLVGTQLPVIAEVLGTGAIGVLTGGVALPSLFAKKGVSKAARKAAAKAAAKKLAKVGGYGAVAKLEAGLNYGELLADHGVNAPFSSLASGIASAAFEALPGGHFGIVDDFINGLAKGASGGYFKKLAKKALATIPSEALQEGGQEFISILNVVANTDEELITPEHIERIAESMRAGGVMGVGGSVVGALAKERKLPEGFTKHLDDNLKGMSEEAFSKLPKDIQDVIIKTFHETQEKEAVAAELKKDQETESTEAGTTEAEAETKKFTTAEEAKVEPIDLEYEEELIDENGDTFKTGEKQDAAQAQHNAEQKAKAYEAIMNCLGR